MKRLITKLSEDKIRQKFPIIGLLDGWFFRQAEVSVGVYEVAGTDLWGRSVSETGTDPEAILARVVASACEIEQQLHNSG
jgi:hypothetical protein